MDQINDFESLLKNRSSKKPLSLYTSNEHPNSSKSGKISAKEVLAIVSRQVKALQNADTASYKRVGNILDKYKKRELIPVDMMPVDRVVHQPTKFETQCVTDTQLINVIENAEIVDKHRGVTQEFEKTFCQNTENTSDDKLSDSRLNPDSNTDTGNDTEPEIISPDRDNILDEHGGVNDHDSKLFENSDIKTCDMDTVTCYQIDLMTDFNDVNSQETQGFNKCVEILNVSEVEADRPVSPVLNTYRKSTTPPLVVDLYAFEKFENLANPIIEEHEDMTMAKNMINSQIIGREILIPAHNSVNLGRDSPVLSKIDFITTNLNKDDVESICTCSNNCVDKDVKGTNEPTTEDISLTSRNKKTQSKTIKTEIKDEILFSSDEEYEYLHKNLQELPLTCALETSFYDRSDVLDKTMYVGFQTASNKSIQINTVSFTKAKSILGEDSEGTGATLSDLVEIFDSGKAVSENVQSLKFSSNKPEFDIDNETSSKIELSHNLIRPSKEFVEKRDDTFENVSLTALERDREDNDEIATSQIIPFKSTSRSVKLNDSIMSQGKVRDTFDNVGLTALDQNKEMDDDIMMSQIITFKSISRTLNSSSVSHESQLGKVIAKRKLEGFKTASNKKIKLSDKALTRCRKVFQDIDLGDSEYMSSESNITETEEIDENSKSHDFNISYDASGASSDVDNTSKERENYICDNITSNKMIPEDCDSETNSKVEEKQPVIEDADLQINDKIILQEFEENEMPLEETNNNAYVTKASYKNMADSDVAIEVTKNIFQDRISVSTTINSDTSIRTADTCIDDSDKHENVFKKPAAEFWKGATKRTKSSTGRLTNIISDIPVIIPQKEEADHEIYDTREPPTKFIGFKTASHKEIIISEGAREKTRDFYRDLDKEIPQNDNIEAAIDSNSGNKNHNVEDEFNCGIDTQDFLAEEITHIEELFKDNVVENEKPNPIVQGFQTASRKAITISEKALEKSKKLFEDITDNVCDYKCRSTKENQVRGISDEIETQKSQDAHTGFEHFDNESHSTDTKPPTNKFMGFLTASNKKINISVEALAKSKKLLNDFEVKDKNNDNGDHDKKNNDNLDSHFGNDSIRFKESDAINDLCLLSTSKFIGFQTASNKAVKISNEALARSKELFEDVDIFDNECDALGKITTGENSIPVFKGYQTASNEKVSIPERALDTSKKLFQDVENCTFPENAPVFQGFQTARNKTVKISENALASNKNLFDDFNLSQLNKDSNTVVESNGLHSNKDVTNHIKGPKVSDQAFARTKYLQVEKVNDDSNPVFRGFQTASNKQLKISEKALAKSKKLFEDINLSQLNTDPILAVDSNGLHRNKATDKGVINDIRDTIISNFENKIVGFQTDSNKTVKVSEQGLAKTKDICKDLHVEKKNNHSTPVFRGFQTASNKQVKTSEKALAKSKKLFEDINLSQYITETKPAVHTDIVNYIKDPIVSNHENKFAGFQTASNKKVIVSDRAMSKTKDIFKNIDIDEERDKNANDKAPVFKGFQTASNKKVAVSEKALVKSKKLFEDINLSQIEEKSKTKADINGVHSAKVDDVMNNIKEPVSVQEYKNNVGGFKTASNRKVNISEQAFAKSKDIFKDIHVDKENDIHVKNNEIKTRDPKAIPKIDNINDINKDVIDTQVLNDFECTLNTEDFCKSTPVSKRSGSPILSCPRAKKRKFETPYRASKKKETRNPFVPPKLAKTYKFNNEYKKLKKYTLKDIEKLEKEFTKADIDPSISEYNFDTLMNLVFKDKRNDYTDEKITTEALKKTFLDSVNKKIVPEGWLDNHIKLIIWKLLSYELKFPNVMNNTCTVRNVLEQLKYRYDRELYHVQRPILRKILEKDEVPSKTMVLCVAAIYVDNVSVTSVPPSAPNVELLVTEGWYCVKACLDRMLIRLVASGAIVVGTKIAVCGAELINCEQGIAPWEDTSSVRLKLHGNSTGRARWGARLGARAGLAPGGLAADGGRAARARLAVTRVYPPVTVERMEDGSTGKHDQDTSSVRLKLHGNSTGRARWGARLGARAGLAPGGLAADGGRAARARLAVTRVYPPVTVERMEDGSTGKHDQDTSSVRLKLHGNSTGRARWGARLGARAGLAPGGLAADGGRAARARLAVTRVYPPVTVERMEDGSTGKHDQDTSSVRLKLHGNSTGRARWGARLGARAGLAPGGLAADGGRAARARLAVTRVYPPVTVERMEDGSTGKHDQDTSSVRLKLHGNSTGRARWGARLGARAGLAPGGLAADGGRAARARLAVTRVYPPVTVERMEDGSTGKHDQDTSSVRLKLHGNSTGRARWGARLGARAGLAPGGLAADGGRAARARLAVTRVYPPVTVERMEDGSTGKHDQDTSSVRLKLHGNSTGRARWGARLGARAGLAPGGLAADGGRAARARLAVTRVYPPVTVERMEDGSTGKHDQDTSSVRLKLHGNSTGRARWGARLGARAGLAPGGLAADGGRAARARLAVTRVYPPVTVERMEDGSTGKHDQDTSSVRLKLHGNSTGRARWGARLGARAGLAPGGLAADGGRAARARLAVTRVYPPVTVERMEDGSTGKHDQDTSSVRLKLHGNSTGRARWGARLGARAGLAPGGLAADGGRAARARLAVTRVYPPVTVERMEDGSTGKHDQDTSSVRLKLHGNSTGRARWGARLGARAGLAPGGLAADGGRAARARLAVTRVYPPVTVERMEDGSTGKHDQDTSSVRLKLHGNSTGRARWGARLGARAGLAPGGLAADGGRAARARLAVTRVYPPVTVERMEDGSTGKHDQDTSSVRLKLHGNSTGRARWGARLGARAGLAPGGLAADGGRAARARLAVTRVYPPVTVERMEDGSTGKHDQDTSSVRLKLHGNSTGRARWGARLGARAGLAPGGLAADGGRAARARLAVTRVYPPVTVERMEDGSTGKHDQDTSSVRLKLHGNSTGRARWGARLGARAGLAPGGLAADGGRAARARLAVTRVYPPVTVERMEDGSTGKHDQDTSSVRLKLHGNSTGRARWGARLGARAGLAPGGLAADGGRAARARLAVTRVYPPVTVERMEDGSTGKHDQDTSSVRLKLHGNSTGRARWGARLGARAGLAPGGLAADGGRAARARLAVTRVYPPVTVERMEDGSTGKHDQDTSSVRLKLHGNSTGRARWGARLGARAGLAPGGLAADGGRAARARLAVTRVYPPVTVERMEDGSTGKHDQDTSSVRLKLHGNSTGRARWGARLGARAGLAPGGLAADGGRAARARLAVTRVYPPVTVERMEDGSTGKHDQDTSSVRLKLHGNSTGRARWGARLGARAGLAPGGLAADGGRAARARLAVTRVYPPVTVERMEDGSTGKHDQDTSSVRLKLHGNSTGRARWGARLGARAGLAPGGLAADGGRAARARLAVTRVYPPVTVERMEDGSTVTLSERLENIRQMRYESERQAIMEKIYEEVEKEMSDLESQDSGGCSNEKSCIDSGSQIARGMKKSKDPDEYRSHLTKSQSRMLEDHNSRQREKQAERVRGRFQEKLEKYGLRTERNVVPLLKARVADFRDKGGKVEVTKGFLSIWRPSAAVTELVTEGAWIEILNVLPTGVRNSEIQLSTGRQTAFNPYKQKNEKLKLYANTLQRKCYEIKDITQNPSMTTDYNEVDTVGMIFCVEPSTKEFHEQSFQNVYLADADKNMICVSLWGGLKKFGYENILDTGQIVTCVNLQKRAGNTRKSIPQYRVTEFSYFTKTPRSKKALEISNELTNKLSKNRDKFCEDCVVLKNNYSIFKTRNIENISPYKFGSTKNILSPACDANLNLTGLDFESSFNSQDISPQALLRKRKVNEKIEKLRLNYGDPPPLSSIHIINQSKNASATYKSPLISNLERSENPLQNVASYRNLVKNVNPVRLDFSNELNESVDHFAEDFDASPPLSLDSDVVNK